MYLRFFIIISFEMYTLIITEFGAENVPLNGVHSGVKGAGFRNKLKKKL